MSSTPQLRQLARELVRIRKAKGMTVEQVTKQLGWSTGRLTYLELHKGVRVDVGNVIRLLDEVYEVTDPERGALLELAKRSREKGWWVAFKDVFPSALPGFEDAATAIRTYDHIIPGLLQTEEYAAGVFSAGQVLDPDLIARKIAGRMRRQDILIRDNPTTLWAIIDEAALLRTVSGPEAMDAQIRHLIERAAWPNITIQVLPFAAGPHAAMDGPFVMLDFATNDDVPLVWLEGAVTSLLLEEAADIQRYNLIFQRAVSSALTPDESVAYLAKLRDELKR